MTEQEDFIRLCSNADFDKNRAVQARVWARVTARGAGVYRRWTFAAVAAGVLFAAGFGAASLMRRPADLPVPSGAAVEYSWTCRAGGEVHPADCSCLRHVSVYGGAGTSRSVRVFSGGTDGARRECTLRQGPPELSFYRSCVTC